MKDWMWATLILGTVALIGWAAKAHEWYPQSCCNDKDCHVVAPDEVEIDAERGGYYFKAYDVFVKFEDMNSSPDGQFHICTYSIAFEGMTMDPDYLRRNDDCGSSGACIRHADPDRYTEMDAGSRCAFGPGMF